MCYTSAPTVVRRYRTNWLRRTEASRAGGTACAGPARTGLAARATRPAAHGWSGWGRQSDCEQASHLRHGQHSQRGFFPRPRLRLGTAIGESGMCQHGARAMPLPAWPGAPLVAIAAGLAYGFFDTLLDGGAGTGHVGHPVQRDRARGGGQLAGDLLQLAHRAACQQPDCWPRQVVASSITRKRAQASTRAPLVPTPTLSRCRR